MNLRSSPRERGFATSTILGLALVLAVVATATILVVSGGDDATEATGADIFPVMRGSFDVTVPASGELTAKDMAEIRSEVDGRASIVEIVQEGKFARAGDVLIRFDDQELRDRLREATLEVENAEARLKASQSSLQIRRESSESELSLARTEVELAQLALRAWEQGTNESQRKSLALELDTAERDFARLEDRFTRSTQLRDQNFISEDEYKRDEIELIRAKSRLEQARLSLDVYLEFTYVEQRTRLESEVTKAQDRLRELSERNRIELENLDRDVRNKEVNLESEREDVAKLEAQIVKCEVQAPRDGLVVYVSSLQSGNWRRDDRSPPTVGTEVRFNEPILILPDTSEMLAEVKVNEALSGRIASGQTATVTSDARPNMVLRGTVERVGVLAESGGWRDPNRRDYTVRIRLAEVEGLGLKPSMRCKTEIHVERVEDVLFVPIQAVDRRDVRSIVYIPDAGGYAERPIRTGRSSELYIEVLEGLVEGDRVLLRTPAVERITSKVERDPSAGGRPGPPSGGGGASGGRPTDGG